MGKFLFSDRFRLLKMILPIIVLGVFCLLSGLEHAGDPANLESKYMEVISGGEEKKINISHGVVKKRENLKSGFRLLLQVGDYFYPVNVPEHVSLKVGDIISLKGTVVPSGIVLPDRIHRHRSQFWKYAVSFPGVLLWGILLLLFFGWNTRKNSVEVLRRG